MASKKNLMFIVHMEESFRDWFDDNKVVARIVAEAIRLNCDVYPLESYVEDMESIPEIKTLAEFTFYQPIHFSWGYEPAQFEDDESELKWLIESSGHEWTWVPEELRKTDWITEQYDTVYLVGGCDSECLADFECVLEHMDIDFTRLNSCIY